MEDARPADRQHSTLGRCPSCTAQIPSHQLLIKYRTTDGWPRLFAECPACLDVVHPT